MLRFDIISDVKQSANQRPDTCDRLEHRLQERLHIARVVTPITRIKHVWFLRSVWRPVCKPWIWLFTHDDRYANRYANAVWRPVCIPIVMCKRRLTVSHGETHTRWDHHGWFSSSMKEPVSHADTVSNFSLTCWVVGRSATPSPSPCNLLVRGQASKPWTFMHLSTIAIHKNKSGDVCTIS